MTTPTDPTRTKTLRGDFEAEVNSRFRGLKGDIREALVDLDVLQLGNDEAVNSAPNPGQYEFLSNPEKRQRFQAWLRQQTDSGVLESVDGRRVRRGDHWTAEYVRRGYAKGVTDTGAKLRQDGVDADVLDDVFNHPVHASKAEMVYTRAYDGLEGITQEMDTQISRELSSAITEGKNPREAARAINDRVDAVGINRARTLSQTEIIHAHAEGSLDRLEAEGFDEVAVDVEHITAGDSNVCPDCAALGGRRYSIEEARGLLPIHPMCRCAIVPITDD